jgi:Uma2 family endonuclease
MTEAARLPTTSETFIAWAMMQPEGERYELVAGQVVAMAPERAAHGRAKFRIAQCLARAVQTAGLPCEVFVDGMAVEIDATTIYEPDVVLRCGAALPDEATKITDPLLVVEIISPSSRARDVGAKLADYFRIPGLRHYLIVRTDDRTIIHHNRAASGAISTSISRDTDILFQPPGIVLPANWASATAP